jgi:hypothetical protein
MILLIIIGIVVLIVGKLRLTRSLVLVSKRARWYGLTLVITAIPFTLIVGGLVAAVTPESVLTHPVWRRLINYALLIAYLVLLALPFRAHEKPETSKLPETTT